MFDPPLRFGRFEISADERVLRIDGEPAVLGARAFDVLLALAERHDRVVPKQELLELVWPGVVVEEHNITVQISTLRKLLGASAITTVPMRGYRFTAVLESGSAAGAPTTEAPARHNLPETRTRFIGREDALAELARLLPTARVVTLTGIGGCGKTRLALRFARDQLAAFPDGVWFVDLSSLTDPTRVVASCAAALGISEAGERPVRERLIAHLASRRSLLVLDNCEQVVAGVGALAHALTGETTILATSREALGVTGEQLYPVRSLSLPATDDVAAVRGAEAARVFLDRAQLVVPDFEIDAHTAAPLAEICRRLDGIALAIELAAGRVTMLSVIDIAERLHDRFRLLTGGDRTLPRHQTLRAAMAWSYEQLAEREQRILRDLSVFAGGWTMQGALDVGQTTDEHEALALLTVLHDKSLLVVDRDRAGGRPRYRMLETVREYGLDRLRACGEEAAARARHLAHQVALAEQGGPQLDGPAQDVWMRRFRTEHENLVAAIRFGCEGGGDPELAMRLTAATALYWRWNSVELGYQLARAVLERAGPSPGTTARARTLISISRLAMFGGRYEEAVAYAHQAVEAARPSSPAATLAQALSTLGSSLEGIGRVEEALPHHEEALGLARGIGDSSLISRVLTSIGEGRRILGQFEIAEPSYREALELARTHGGRTHIVLNLNNLIRLKVAMNEVDDARRLAVECLAYSRTENTVVDLVEACAGLASLQGAHDLAVRFYLVADRTMHAWGYRFQPVDVAHAARFLAASREALGAVALAAAEAAAQAMELPAAITELEQWLAR